MDNFKDYMWYLLTSPFKQVKKTLNAWWIWCRVIGGMFDDAKEALETAREEGMIATCSDLMVPLHGAERGLTRYAGEDMENYRRRVAMYAETCILGGLAEGVILAVKAHGYTDVEIRRTAEVTGDQTRWAEFHLIISMDTGDTHPVPFDILKKTVRRWKASEALDNYLIQYHSSLQKQYEIGIAKAEYRQSAYFFNYRKLDGTHRLNGEYSLNAQYNGYPVIITDGDGGVQMTTKGVITNVRRKKMAEASHTTGTISKITHIALGSGGVDGSGNVIEPLGENTALRNEVLRRQCTSVKKNDTCYAYTVELGALELIGTYISEMALIDADGDVAAISNFLAKGKDQTVTTFTIEDNY